jgi:hypothetical protein
VSVVGEERGLDNGEYFIARKPLKKAAIRYLTVNYPVAQGILSRL